MKYSKQELLDEINKKLINPVTTRTLTNWINQAGIKHPSKKGQNRFLYDESDLKKIEIAQASKLKENPTKKVTDLAKKIADEKKRLKQVNQEFKANKEEAGKTGLDPSEYYEQLLEKYQLTNLIDTDEQDLPEYWVTENSEEVQNIKIQMQITALFENGLSNQQRSIDTKQLAKDLNRKNQLAEKLRLTTNQTDNPFDENFIYNEAKEKIELNELTLKLKDWRMYTIYDTKKQPN